MSKRVWKPLDVGGLRLYNVIVTCYQAIPGDPSRIPRDEEVLIVAAQSPRHAASIVEAMHPPETRRADEEWDFRGEALKVCQPADWWSDGIPCPADWHDHEPGARVSERPAPEGK